MSWRFQVRARGTFAGGATWVTSSELATYRLARVEAEKHARAGDVVRLQSWSEERGEWESSRPWRVEAIGGGALVLEPDDSS